MRTIPTAEVVCLGVGCASISLLGREFTAPSCFLVEYGRFCEPYGRHLAIPSCSLAASVPGIQSMCCVGHFFEIFVYTIFIFLIFHWLLYDVRFVVLYYSCKVLRAAPR